MAESNHPSLDVLETRAADLRKTLDSLGEMDRQGLPVVFLRYPREGHGIGEPRHRVDLYQRQMAWFDHYLKGEGKRSPDGRYD